MESRFLLYYDRMNYFTKTVLEYFHKSYQANVEIYYESVM